VLPLFDPVVGEALLLGFFELRRDVFDAKVVGVGMFLIWQGWRGKFCRINFTCCPCRDAVAAGVYFYHGASSSLVLLIGGLTRDCAHSMWVVKLAPWVPSWADLYERGKLCISIAAPMSRGSQLAV
jgi:hypothetical protein